MFHSNDHLQLRRLSGGCSLKNLGRLVTLVPSRGLWFCFQYIRVVHGVTGRSETF